jgi:hypothetical protein
MGTLGVDSSSVKGSLAIPRVADGQPRSTDTTRLTISGSNVVWGRGAQGRLDSEVVAFDAAEQQDKGEVQLASWRSDRLAAEPAKPAITKSTTSWAKSLSKGA